MPKPKGEDSSATSAAAKKKQHTGADGEPEADEVIIAAASLGRGSYAFAVRRDATACPGSAQGGFIAGGSPAASHAHDTPLCREANAFRSDCLCLRRCRPVFFCTRVL